MLIDKEIKKMIKSKEVIELNQAEKVKHYIKENKLSLIIKMKNFFNEVNTYKFENGKIIVIESYYYIERYIYNSKGKHIDTNIMDKRSFLK